MVIRPSWIFYWRKYLLSFNDKYSCKFGNSEKKFWGLLQQFWSTKTIRGNVLGPQPLVMTGLLGPQIKQKHENVTNALLDFYGSYKHRSDARAHSDQ